MVIAGSAGKEGGWVAVYSVTLQTIDGESIDKIVLIDRQGKPEPVILSERKEKLEKQDGRWLLTIPNKHPGVFQFLLFGEKAAPSEVDPFDVDPFVADVRIPRKATSLPALILPDSFQRHNPLGAGPITWETIDVSEPLRRAGIRISEGDTAGYDPICDEFFFLTDSSIKAEKVQTLFLTYGPHDPVNCQVILKATNTVSLLGTSGMKMFVQVGELPDEEQPCPADHFYQNFEFEPTIAERSSMVDSRLVYQIERANHSSFLNTSLTLEAGKPVPVHQPPEAKDPWTVEAEVETFSR